MKAMKPKLKNHHPNLKFSFKPLFRIFWRIIVFPFSVLWFLIVRPVKRFRSFMNDIEPLDHLPPSETISKPIDEINILIEQVTVLRKHVFRSVLWILFLSIGSFFFLPQILKLIQIPANAITKLELGISGPGEMLDLIPRTALVSGLVLSIPYILFEIWLFAAPGLTVRARKLGLALVFVSPLIFFIGILFGFYFFLPESILYLFKATQTYGIFEWDLVNYLSFSFKILVSSGLLFLFPLLVDIYVLLFPKSKLNVRFMIILIFIGVAALTPGSMIILDLGLTVLLALLYYLFFILTKITIRRKS